MVSVTYLMVTSCQSQDRSTGGPHQALGCGVHFAVQPVPFRQEKVRDCAQLTFSRAGLPGLNWSCSSKPNMEGVDDDSAHQCAKEGLEELRRQQIHLNFAASHQARHAARQQNSSRSAYFSSILILTLQQEYHRATCTIICMWKCCVIAQGTGLHPAALQQ